MALAPADQQARTTHDIEQTVAPHIHAIVATEHNFKFAHSHLGVAFTYLTYRLKYAVHLYR